MRSDEHLLVAVDGPAGAGKSTLARSLAASLGLPCLDTGAMYRAVAWAALDRHLDPADSPEVGRLARSIDIEVSDRVRVEGRDVTDAIRSPEVDAAVSLVAANPEVRAELVARQRAWARERGGGVMEGRDIGTVVLPDADLKVYLTANLSERARRRAVERRSAHRPDTGSPDTGSLDTGSLDTGSLDTGSLDTGSLDTGSLDTGSLDTGERRSRVHDPVAASLQARDRLDSTRIYDPLPSPEGLPEGTLVIDSTALDAAGVLELVLRRLSEARQAKVPPGGQVQEGTKGRA